MFVPPGSTEVVCGRECSVERMIRGCCGGGGKKTRVGIKQLQERTIKLKRRNGSLGSLDGGCFDSVDLRRMKMFVQRQGVSREESPALWWGPRVERLGRVQA